MRTTTLLSSLGLALTLGGGVAAAQAPAQAPAQRHGRAEQAEGHRRGGRGPEGFLLKGITLTADQQARVADLQKQWRADRPNETRERGAQRQDSAQGQRGPRGQRTPADRAAMQQRMEQHVAALRAILTADQQRTFDANVAQMKQRFAQRGQGNGQGWRHNGGSR